MTIKNLRYVNNAQTFKLNDTSTRLRLQASLGSTVVDFSEKDNLSVKIKNASGYLMEVEPTVDSNKTLSFNSSQLQELPVGHYEIELWVVNQAGTSIYPSQGYLSFTINENSIGFNGEAIPTITLHEFEERIDKLEKDLRAKADNGDFDGEKGEPGDKGDPGKDATNNDPNAVHVSGNQAISGVKNFIDTPTINGNKVLDDSLQIGGRNLLIGTSNEWQSKSESNSGWGTVLVHDVTKLVEVGKTYVYQLYKGKSTHSGHLLVVCFDKKGGSIIGTFYSAGATNYSYVGRLIDTFTVPEGTGYVEIRGFVYEQAYPGYNSLQWKQEKLEIGSKATDWTPAPEDIGTSQPIMSGNYGLRVTADGFQKTTDGGATWTTADI